MGPVSVVRGQGDEGAASLMETNQWGASKKEKQFSETERDHGLKFWVKDFSRIYLFGLTSHRHDSLTLSLLLLLLEKTLQTAKNNAIGYFLNHRLQFMQI